MGLPPANLSRLRQTLHELLRLGARADDRQVASRCLVHAADAEMTLPALIGDYTDFFASIDHALTVGSILKAGYTLPQNYRYLPLAYHGRASTVIVSGTPVHRPQGQQRIVGDAIGFGPTRQLDYELELGFFVGQGSVQGSPIPIDRAAEHLFGCCLLNDWSAREIQWWESQPLGPFLAKSFATTVSPWVVTLEALAPFRVAARERADDDPPLMSYLLSREDQRNGAFDITLEALLSTSTMRDEKRPPFRLAETNARTLYWTIAQMVAHHTVNGCNLRPGDVIGTGTTSGPQPAARGCLLELTRGGKDAVRLPTGESRRFLEDGDEVVFRAACRADRFRAIGFGECRGQIRNPV
jgi:fumarylacetoacetase